MVLIILLVIVPFVDHLIFYPVTYNDNMTTSQPWQFFLIKGSNNISAPSQPS